MLLLCAYTVETCGAGGMRLLLASFSAVLGVALAQEGSQCSPDYLTAIQRICCTTADGADTCNGGTPTECDGNCATLFLDFYDNCGMAGNPQFDPLATTCRSTFQRCSTRAHNAERVCDPNARCVPLLEDLACSKPPCEACVCGPGLMGDGATCIDIPEINTGPPVPGAIASGDCQPVAVNDRGTRGVVTPGVPQVYCLDATPGETYTINVDLSGLQDSVLELWSSTEMIDSNDDYGGSLGSQLEWTAPADGGRFYVLVRGYSDANAGQFTVTVRSSGATTGPPPPAGGGGADCIGCFYRGQCRDLATNPTANPATCAANGGSWQGAGEPCNGGVTLGSATGSITFTDSYADNAVCTWTITCPRSDRAPEFVFSAMDTESGYDFVTLYDGTSQDGEQLQQYSGNIVPPPVHMPGQSATVAFTSDGSVQGPGFSVDYRCGQPSSAPPPPPSMVLLTPPAHVTGEVVHGGDLVLYTMAAAAGNTYVLETSQSGTSPLADSYLIIYDNSTAELAHDDDSGAGAQARLAFTAPYTGVYMINVRGYNRQQTGTFDLDVTQAAAGPCVGGGLTLPGTQGVIAFSDSPYENSMSCSWLVACPVGQQATVTLTNLDTERNYDWVSVYDGPSAGGPQAMRVSGTLDALESNSVTTAGPAFVQFTTDGSVTRGGFDATYSCAPAGGAGGCTPIRVDTRPVQGTVSGDGRRSTPAAFCLQAEAGQTYELTVELLTLRDSVMSIVNSAGTEVERNDDDGGSLASHIIWTAPASGIFTVNVDGFGGQTGDFSLDVTSMGGAGGGGGNPCQGGLTLTEPAGVIDFDDTGVLSSTCDWLIRCTRGDGITIDFETLSVESHFDYVSVYDGTAPSSDEQLVHATGNELPDRLATQSREALVEYTSDGSVSRGGFAISYRCGTVDIDPGFGQPLLTPNSGPQQGSVAGDSSMYSMTASGGVTYQIEVTLGTLHDSVLEIYAPDGQTMLTQNDDYGGQLSSFIEWTCPSDGAYFVLVRGFSAQQTGDYTIEVTTDSGTSGGSSGDPCGGGLNLNAPSAVISYQPRGQYEDNEHCTWAVTCPGRGEVPSFTFTALDTEGGFDFVTISDGNALTAGYATPMDRVSGRLQNLERVSYQSQSPSLTIQFETDGSVTGVGFEGSYACGRPEAQGPTCEDTIEELNGVGACNGFIAQGFSCAQRFCPSCTYSSMCDATCGFCQSQGGGHGPGTQPGDGCTIIDVMDRGGVPRPQEVCFTTNVESRAASQRGMTTYTLSITLPPEAQNVYTVFGAPPAPGSGRSSVLSVPPAYQEPAPFGVNTGGVNPAFLPIQPSAADDSWLTVGITDGDSHGSLSSIGIDWDGWSLTQGITADDGAVFWMDPNAAPGGTVTVAQLTARTGLRWEATMGMQGKSCDRCGDDWVVHNAVFTNGQH